MTGSVHTPSDTGTSARRRDELLSFLILTVVLAPVVSVIVVGGYGFLVWMSQLIWGLPA